MFTFLISQRISSNLHIPFRSLETERDISIPVRLCALVGFLFFVMLVPGLLVAQTEFQGDVSGVWDSDGNPYIQVGAANVPEEQVLTIMPGVEVIIGEDMTLTGNGLIFAIGTEEDTIRIRGPEGIISGRILLQANGDAFRFEYCRFDSLETALSCEENSNIEVRNCLFFEDESFMHGGPRNAEITDCSFITLSLHSRLWLNFNTETQLLFTDNWIFGDITMRFQCDQGLVARNRSRPYVTPDDFEMSSICMWNCRNFTIQGNDSLVIFSDNFRGRIDEAQFLDNVLIGGGVGGFGARHLIFRNNVVVSIHHSSGFSFWNVDDGEVSDNASEFYRFEGNCTLLLERNLGQVVLERENNVLTIANCTMVAEFARLGPDYGVIGPSGDMGEGNRVILNNNILFGRLNCPNAVSDGITVEGSGYNVIWGVEQAYVSREGLLRNDRIIDPLLRAGFPYDYRLRADSPCIDAANPDSPPDPDGTRTDIGCYYFDQENGEQPALDRRWDYYIGWNETFRYAAKAVDEGEALEFSFEGLPEWLEIEEEQLGRDFVRDSVVVSGVVPENQEDFVFHVKARDDAEREDSLSVRVMVYPYRVLTGIVHGVLDVEQSPFIVADTAWIPVGDSLVLPPGTELFFDNREDNLAGRELSRLVVEGIFKAVGVEGDSVYLEALDLEGSRSHFIFTDNEDGLTEFKYCRFTHIQFQNTVLGADISISHSLGSEGVANELQATGFHQPTHLHHNMGNLRIILRGWGVAESNDMRHLVINRGDSVLVHDNILVGLTTTYDTRAIVYNNQLEGVNILGGGAEHLDWVAVRNNYISDKIKVFNPPAEITNNIIDSQGAIGIELNPSFSFSTIANNVVIGAGVGLDIRMFRDDDQSRQNINIKNNIFLACDTLLTSLGDRSVGGGINYNSIYDFEFLATDTIYNTQLTQINTNGDSTDAYFNLYIDPKIADSDSLDFRLYVNSPLINAGNPDSAFFDIDGTINDIGLFGGPYGTEYEYIDPDEVISFVKPAREFHVSQTYPNPFNSTAQISIELPKQGNVTCVLFDVQGRRVARNVIPNLSAGMHKLPLAGFLNHDLSGLNSGMYFIVIEFQNKTVKRKLILAK